MSEEMTTKYQQHYNQILSGTLTESIMKSISYQANIKLANEIIAEQEKTITELKENFENKKKEFDSLKTNMANADSLKISNLESNLRNQTDTITRLNSELSVANKVKIEYDSLKAQVNNAETFRTQLIKERELHKQTKERYDLEINELMQKIQLLENPPKKKKVKVTPVVEKIIEPEQEQNNLLMITETPMVENVPVRDGGIF